MGAKIGVLLNCGQQSQFSKVRREFDAGRVNLDPPMTYADWPVPGNLTLLHPQTAYTRKPLHRFLSSPCITAAGYVYCVDIYSATLPFNWHARCYYKTIGKHRCIRLSFFSWNFALVPESRPGDNTNSNLSANSIAFQRNFNVAFRWHARQIPVLQSKRY